MEPRLETAIKHNDLALLEPLNRDRSCYRRSQLYIAPTEWSNTARLRVGTIYLPGAIDGSVRLLDKLKIQLKGTAKLDQKQDDKSESTDLDNIAQDAAAGGGNVL